jgi:hypothetical protein
MISAVVSNNMVMSEHGELQCVFAVTAYTEYKLVVEIQSSMSDQALKNISHDVEST